MIIIVDLGVGNFSNVKKAVKGKITNDPDKIAKAEKVILPGVGAFGFVSRKLTEIKEAVSEIIEKGNPVLGICLGMQLFFEKSEEGEGKGLGFIKGKVVRFKKTKSPHIGWNRISIKQQIKLLEGIKSGSFFYFVHSYYVKPDDPTVTKAFTEFGGVEFPSVVVKNNIFGVQFHPEKSSDNGLKLLENFRRL